MKMPIIIYVLIILLAGIGIVLMKLKFGSADNVKWTDLMQVILTAALVIVTGINVYLVRQTIDEMAKSRISQEESNNPEGAEFHGHARGYLLKKQLNHRKKCKKNKLEKLPNLLLEL